MTEPDNRDPLKNLEGCMGEDIEKVMTTEVIHDFKNILTGILGNLAIAKDWSNPGDSAYPFIEAAERVTKHANQLALQLLANTKGGGRQHFEFSVAKVIRESVDLMIGGSHCRSQVFIDTDLSLIKGDETRITQVLNNLLVNAKQAMPDGGVISVRASNVLVSDSSEFEISPGRYLKISIEDEGVGIPEEDLKKIFRMHYTTKKEGTGIGLASCIYIIKDHGGSMHVESEIGEGSVFTILLPCLDKVDSDAVLKNPGNCIPDAEGCCVLVMDDELMVQQTIGDMLSVFDYDVEFANDGDSALKLYSEAYLSGKPYSLVIMDLTIPGGMGGVEAVKGVLKIDPNARVVVSSGHPSDPAMTNPEKFGFSGAIQKPYTLKDLQDVLANSIVS